MKEPNMEERRIDLRQYDPDSNAEMRRTTHVLHQLNQAEPGTNEYGALVKELFTGGYGKHNILAAPLFVNRASHLHIGSHVSIQPYFKCMAAGEVFIDDYAQIAMNVSIITNNHDFYDRHILLVRDVHVCRNAWIGAGATILPGVTVGENAVVGAGSIVTKDVEPNTVVVGNPAHVIRRLDPARFAEISDEPEDSETILMIDIPDILEE